jgi:protein gp37
VGKETGISWTRSTRNFWSGCTKVGPGCDGCYAEASSRRMRGVNAITLQANNWGPGAPRVPHLEGADRDIRKWNAACTRERTMAHQKRDLTTEWARPGFWPVFLNSYSDTFDNEVPQDWRRLMFTTIEDCESLTFQLVTKRIGNVEGMLEGRWNGGAPRNVWLIITVVNQQELDRDGPKLLELGHRLGLSVIGLSIEPQIGEIDARPFLEEAKRLGLKVWGIVGGESAQAGHPARPFVYGWAKRLITDFHEFGQAIFVKQTGSNCMNREGVRHPGITGKGDKPAEWPEDLRVQEFPA